MFSTLQSLSNPVQLFSRLLVLTLSSTALAACSATIPSDPGNYGMRTEQRGQISSSIAMKQVVFVTAGDTDIELRLGCQAPGVYEYKAVPPAIDRIRVKNGLWVKGDFQYLSAGVEGVRSLALNITSVGQYRAKFSPPSASNLQGDDCAKATHYVVSASVGAFSLEGLNKDTGEFSIEAGGKGVKLGAEQIKDFLSKSGDPAKCVEGPSPPAGCNSIVAVTLASINSKTAANDARPQLARVVLLNGQIASWENLQ